MVSFTKRGTYNIVTGVYTSPSGLKSSTATPPPNTEIVFVDTKRPNFVSSSGGGGSSSSSLPVSSLATPTDSATTKEKITYYGTVTPVKTLSREDIRRTNLKKAQQKLLIDLKRRSDMRIIPVSTTLNQIQKAKERAEGTEILLQTISKEQARVSTKTTREKSKDKGKVTPLRDVYVGSLGLTKVPLNVLKSSQEVVSVLTNVSKNTVLFLKNKPFKQIETTIKNLTYASISSGINIRRKKFATRLKGSPTQVLGQGLVDFYLLGGRVSTVKKFLTYEVKDKVKKELQKGLYLSIKAGEKPVLFKYMRGKGVSVFKVKQVIQQKLGKLRKRKSFYKISEKTKPIVINLGEIKFKPVPKPKTPRFTLKGSKKYPSEIKKTVLKTETGDKIIVFKDINKLRKQAQERLKKQIADTTRKIKIKRRLQFNKPSKIHIQAIKNFKEDLKRKKKLLNKSRKIQERITKNKKKLLTLQLKQRGFKVKKLTTKQQKKAKVRGVKFQSKLRKQAQKKELKELKAQRLRTIKIIKKPKVTSIQRLALKRFKENNKAQLKRLSKTKNKETGIRIIETNINQAQRQVQILKQLPQQKIPKPQRQKVYIINDKLVEAQKRLNKLKKQRTIQKSKLVQEVKKVQDLKMNMFNAVYGVSRFVLSPRERVNLAERLSSGQSSSQQQRDKQKEGQASTFVESSAISQSEKTKEILRELLKQKQIQEKAKSKPKRRIGLSLEFKRLTKKKKIPNGYILGYDVYGKQKKKFVKLNTVPLKKFDSLSRGSYAVDKTTSKTFKIVPVGYYKVRDLGSVLKREKGYFTKTKPKFREYRIKNKKRKFTEFKLIERRKHFKDTSPEKKNVSLIKFKRKHY